VKSVSDTVRGLRFVKELLQKASKGAKLTPGEVEMKNAISSLALSGLVGGGSAALQYYKGVQLGKVLTPEQRGKL
jgi:hypothetical protein